MTLSEAEHRETEHRRSILSRFFSRTEPRDHADVYLLQNLSQELRATLNGLYSRSRHSMRDTFLQRLEKGLEQQGKTLCDLQIPDSSPEEALSGILVEKAGEFLRTYAIDHGHNSLREGAVLHIAVEKVSQLVTRFMQRERRASFEESSTRYISFAKEGHFYDPELMAAGEPWSSLYETAIDESFAFYQESIKGLREAIRESKPCAEGEDEKAHERALGAEAFDSARYLLTPALYTKFGLVADARTVADMVTALLSHPLEEFRIVGRRIKEEAQKQVPTLLTHAGLNSYLRETLSNLREISATLDEQDVPSAIPSENKLDVQLLGAPKDLDQRLLASLLYEEARGSHSQITKSIQAMNLSEREALFEKTLASRGARDAVPEGFEGAAVFDFELLVDFGAFRDIGRHRKGFLQQQRLTTAHGFVVPKLFDQAGLGARYRSLMQSVGQKACTVAQRFPFAAEYIIPFGYLQRVRLRFDARQMAYFIELRSTPEGHFSYREVAIRMADALAEKAPLYARYIRCCRDEVVMGRSRSEGKRDERREKRRESARKQGFESQETCGSP